MRFDAPLPDLHDLRLLVVEDEYLAADEMRHALEALGARVVGPAASVAHAMAVIEVEDGIDGAILDVNLCGERVYPVAGALHAQRVPFVFWTGYAPADLPADFAGVPRVQKPASATDVVRVLLRDLALPQRGPTPRLADLYLAPDGAHLLVVRAGRDPLRDMALVWIGAAFVDAAEWSRRLRTPLVPGVPVRVPWRYLATIRHELAMMG